MPKQDKSHHQIIFRRLRAENADLVKTSVLTFSTHTTDASWTQRLPLNTRFETLRKSASPKRLTKERKTKLAASALGGDCLKMSPTKLPNDVPSCYIVQFVKAFRCDGLLGPQAHPRATRRTQHVARGHRNGPCRRQNPAKQPPAQTPRSK